MNAGYYLQNDDGIFYVKSIHDTEAEIVQNNKFLRLNIKEYYDIIYNIFLEKRDIKLPFRTIDTVKSYLHDNDILININDPILLLAEATNLFIQNNPHLDDKNYQYFENNRCLGFTIPLIKIPKAEWNLLVKYAEKHKWPFPITLSCNEYEEIWYSRKYGYHDYAERENITEKEFPFLKDIYKIVLKEKPKGGRFHLDGKFCKLTIDRGYKVVAILLIE